MPEPPVVDSSPLIHLARAGHLDLLRVAGSQLVVPAAVVTEIRAKGESLIPLARPVMQELISRGMYLSPATVEQALALVGE